MAAGVGRGCPCVCSTATEAVGGGGTAASSNTQPMQQELSQSLWLFPVGAVCPGRVEWQITTPGEAVSAKAERTAPKLPIRPESAIA